MSMTREQAVQEILDAVTELDRWSVPKAVEEALSILAPEPRTEPPTVEGELVCIDTSYAMGTVYFTLRCKIQEPMMRMKSGMQCTLSALPKGDV